MIMWANQTNMSTTRLLWLIVSLSAFTQEYSLLLPSFQLLFALKPTSHCLSGFYPHQIPLLIFLLLLGLLKDQS